MDFALITIFRSGLLFIIRMNWVIWFFAAAILFAIAGDLAKIMTSLNHNEHMYITAGVLVSQNKVLYRDFAYLQMPYLPLLYGGLYQLLGITSFYFLWGKLVSFLALIASASVLFLIARRAWGEVTIASGLAALFLLNMSIVNPAREASNYIVPVFLSFLAVYFFEIAQRNPNRKWLLMAITGILSALAVGVKLTYAPILFPFMAVIVLFSIYSKESFLAGITHQFLPFLAGLLIGFLPMAGFIVQDPAVFMFNNLGYHTINTQWRILTGYTDNMSLSSKFVFAGETFLKADNLMLLFGILFGAGLTILHFRQTKQFSAGGVLALFLFLSGLISALFPTPSFSQYYAVPISFLFILFIYLWAVKLDEAFLYRRMILTILVLSSLLYQGSSLFDSISKLRYRHNWTPLHVRDISIKLREVLQENQPQANGKVATLSPLFAVEAGLPIYPELASGPFLYRVGDLLSAEQRNHFVGTSPATIHDLFEKDPPAAILTGFEGELDQPLVVFALAKGYKKIDLSNFEGNLYLYQAATTNP